MQRELPGHYSPWMEIANRLPQLIESHQLRAQVNEVQHFVFFSLTLSHYPIFILSPLFFLNIVDMDQLTTHYGDFIHRTKTISLLVMSGITLASGMMCVSLKFPEPTQNNSWTILYEALKKYLFFKYIFSYLQKCKNN